MLEKIKSLCAERGITIAQLERELADGLASQSQTREISRLVDRFPG